MSKLTDFKGKIITIGRGSPGPEYANDFLFPDGVRKEVAYVDSKGKLNYISGMCDDNSACYFGSVIKDLENDVKKNYNITYIREVNDDELKVYIKECASFFNSVLKEKGRPPFGYFPLPIIDSIVMDEFWKDALIREQEKG